MGKSWLRIPASGAINWRKWSIKGCRTTALLVIVLAFLMVYLVRKLPEAAIHQISRITGARLNQEAITIDYQGQVVITNLTIAPPDQPETYDNTILRAQHLVAKFSLLSLLKCKPTVQSIELKDFTLDAQFDMDNGRWNIEGLSLKFKGSGGRGTLPTIRLNNGTLRYTKVSQGTLEVASEIPLSMDFRSNPTEENPSKYDFTINTGPIWRGIGQSQLNGTWQKGQLVMSGGIASHNPQETERTWSINAMALDCRYDDNLDYRLKTRLRHITSQHSHHRKDRLDPVRPVFLRNFNLATRFQRFVDRYDPQGSIDLEWNATGNLHQFSKSRMDGKIICHDVSMLDQTFQYPVEHLQGVVEFTQNGIGSTRLEGFHGITPVNLDFNFYQSEGKWTSHFHCSSSCLPLDQDIFSALPAKEQTVIDCFDLEGNASVDYTWNKDQTGAKYCRIVIEPLDIKAAYKPFPYPLDHLRGSLEIVNEDLTIHQLTSEHQDRKVTITGSVKPGNIKDLPDYDIRINAEKIPLNQTLAQSFNETLQLTYQKLDPTGKIDAVISIKTGKTEVIREVETTLQQASFILPNTNIRLENAQGHLMLYPQTLLLRDVQGQLDQGTLRINGDFELDDQMCQTSYRLTMNGHEVGVPQLLTVLPTTLNERLAPWDIQGSVDLKATLKQAKDQNDLQYSTIIDLNQNIVTPPFLPSSLNQITGTITANNQDILLENLYAVPHSSDPNDNVENAGLRLSGQLKVEKDRIIQGKIALLAHHFPVTEEVGESLPQKIEQALYRLAPHGPVSIDIPVLTWAVDPNGETQAKVRLKGSTDNLQVKLINQPVDLAGDLNLDMNYSSAQGITFGIMTLTADHFTFREKTAQDIATTLVFNPSQKSWIAQDVHGDFYGGHLLGRFDIGTAGTDPQCNLQLTLAQVNLDDLLAPNDPNSPARKATQGMLNGSLSISNMMNHNTGPLGRGTFEVTQMRAGYITTLAKILAVLQLGKPQEIIFERILVDSYLKGNTLFLERCDIAGDIVALRGEGSVNLEKEEIDLHLKARGKRLATENPSAWVALTESIGGAAIRVDVQGNLYDPTITTKPLPLLEDSLHILGIPQTP